MPSYARMYLVLAAKLGNIESPSWWRFHQRHEGVKGSSWGLQQCGRATVPRESPVAMVDPSSFGNAGAMWQSPEASATMKWSWLGSRGQAVYMLLRAGTKRWSNPSGKPKGLWMNPRYWTLNLFALLELGFALCRLWLCPVSSLLKLKKGTFPQMLYFIHILVWGHFQRQAL